MAAAVVEVHMAEGVVDLEPRVARIESDVANLKESVARLDERVERLDEKVDERFDGMNERVNALGERMSGMERGLKDVSGNQATLHGDMRDLRTSLDTKFIWIVSTMFAFGAAILAVLAEGFHRLK